MPDVICNRQEFKWGCIIKVMTGHQLNLSFRVLSITLRDRYT